MVGGEICHTYHCQCCGFLWNRVFKKTETPADQIDCARCGCFHAYPVPAVTADLVTDRRECQKQKPR